MAIHTFGAYMDFHPHVHALVADGLFVRSGLFHVLPDVSLKPLEELFRARVITFLVDKGLLPVARANMLRGCMPGTELCSGARGAFRVQRPSQPAGPSG